MAGHNTTETFLNAVVFGAGLALGGIVITLIARQLLQDKTIL